MDAVELRPLSLGEILDRTFTMYRRHFLFFITLAGIFQIPSLAFALFQVRDGLNASFSLDRILLALAGYCIAIVCYVLANGGAVLAISEFYLGHTVTITQTISRIWSRFWALLGTAILNYFVFIVGLLFLIVPGVYIICRLLIAAPVVIVDRKGPGSQFSRSWELTKGFAGRSFLIILLYIALIIAISMVTTAPISFLIAASLRDPERLRWLLMLQAVVASAASILIAPILQIAVAVFYFDLRVRKEAFDLQYMMNPDASADDPRFLTEA